jgi:hypothetical protein
MVFLMCAACSLLIIAIGIMMCDDDDDIDFPE